MSRPARLIGLVLAAVSAPVSAQTPLMRAEFTAPLVEKEVVIDGRLWSCSGHACTARGDDARPAIACRKLARKLGPVVRFATSRAELDTAGLATCNQDRN